ncbi:hypothetical protein ACFOWB_03445 [Chenggangzhangella methanolivorans]|uniref:hypothetical protein n=1 Tax=Chenggangzhangella methanolivorans TaxID=1437009 RepID=UPI003617F2B1
MVARDGRPTCFIHIGPPKTGSSTISHFVEGNAEAFAEQGLYVPKMPALKGRPMNGHGIFANVDELDARGELKPAAKLWPELEEIASQGRQNIVLTSESFAHAFRDGVVLDRILAFFERHGYAVVIIAYLRDQPSSLNSSYVQSQKRLVKRMTFEEFVDEAARTGKVDPWRYLEHIIDNPRLTLDAGCFETAVKSGLEKDISRRLGLPDEFELAYPEVRNRNAGAKAVFAAQMILQQIGDIRASKLAAYKKINRRFKSHFEERGWTEAPYVGLDQDLYGRIRDYYSEGNERFAQRFFGASWKELSPDRDYARKVFDPATASEEELAEIEEVVTDMVRMIQRLNRKQQAAAATAATAETDAGAQAIEDAPDPLEEKTLREMKRKRNARAAKAMQIIAEGEQAAEGKGDAKSGGGKGQGAGKKAGQGGAGKKAGGAGKKAGQGGAGKAGAGKGGAGKGAGKGQNKGQGQAGKTGKGQGGKSGGAKTLNMKAGAGAKAGGAGAKAGGVKAGLAKAKGADAEGAGKAKKAGGDTKASDRPQNKAAAKQAGAGAAKRSAGGPGKAKGGPGKTQAGLGKGPGRGLGKGLGKGPGKGKKAQAGE